MFLLNENKRLLNRAMYCPRSSRARFVSSSSFFLVLAPSHRVHVDLKDILCRGRTGSGKTAAYCLPLLHVLLQAKKTSSTPGVRAVVLLPSRELSQQVTKCLKVCASRPLFFRTLRINKSAAGLFCGAGLDSLLLQSLACDGCFGRQRDETVCRFDFFCFFLNF